ncbi:MAG: rhomboid family intramembrane serine protease [Bacteroidia bacterium]|nr:rhomboid family intramembrane serine protease [Bacteroidia bacterium]
MITFTLLGLIIVFSIICFRDRNAMAKYLFSPYAIKHNNEHYRFLSHAFIHGNEIHLIFNCLALYGFGSHLEDVYFPYIFGDKLGRIYYLLLFTGGIYAASFTEYYLHKNNPIYSSLGASGAVSALMMCSIVIDPIHKIGYFFIPMPGLFAGLLLLGVSFYLIMRKRKGTYDDNISHESHFWGAMFGIVFILVLEPRVGKHFVNQVMMYFNV